MSDNKVAIVTGASRGIGRAIAKQLAEDGMKVMINYRGQVKAAQEVKKEIEILGGEAYLYPCDVADQEACDTFIKSVIKDHGRIDILVNNAGITRDGLLMAMKECDFDAVINTNLKGTFHMMSKASRYMMKQRSGKIINMASVVGISGNAGQANYAASKAGVIGLTKSAAKELASRGITVNAVAPGFIATDMTDELSDKVKENVKKQIPLGSFGSTDDVAGVVAFLASDKANYITGQVICVDGGMVM
ncbi:3-oxoacyl-[acyl-carrier protein] reductase [Lachnospiraceae bacterium KM106-2]|nr:3-oxoacyl-[acyl-carrier protein] reductase [Lachnospiraceae bacterium KM106-2]